MLLAFFYSTSYSSYNKLAENDIFVCTEYKQYEMTTRVIFFTRGPMAPVSLPSHFEFWTQNYVIELCSPHSRISNPRWLKWILFYSVLCSKGASAPFEHNTSPRSWKDLPLYYEDRVQKSWNYARFVLYFAKVLNFLSMYFFWGIKCNSAESISLPWLQIPPPLRLTRLHSALRIWYRNSRR